MVVMVVVVVMVVDVSYIIIDQSETESESESDYYVYYRIWWVCSSPVVKCYMSASQIYAKHVSVK